jgi:uncharacterized membrane protein
MDPRPQREIYIGISLAIFTTLIWSGNFVVARAAYRQIPPVSLAFYRWLSATVIILPFGFQKVIAEKTVLLKNASYIFWTALTGIGLFNTCIYVAGHYSPAINLALIGTTSSPIMAVVLARIFLKENVTWIRIFGLAICISGILLLMGKGSLHPVTFFIRRYLDITWSILLCHIQCPGKEKAFRYFSACFCLHYFYYRHMYHISFFFGGEIPFFAGAMEQQFVSYHPLSRPRQFCYFLFVLECGHCKAWGGTYSIVRQPDPDFQQY